jgi:hypothetical protein
LRDYVAALPAPRDRSKTLTALAELVTASHDGGALFQDDPGARKSGNARARAKGIAFRALVAECFYGRSESPHFIAELDRAATP